MGRQRITTPFEVRVILTSTWRNRFVAAWKLLKFLSYATGTRISVCTARNRLRGARLIFALWNFNFNIDLFVQLWWRKWVYFQNVLLKMFTFVRHYKNLILSKVFVNIKTVLQNYCTQCLYWLNFFFWVYFVQRTKKIVPDQTALNFLYNSLHATYLVILLSSADSFQNRYFQEISGKKIKVSNCMGPDQDQTYCWSWSDSKLFMNVISRWQKFDDQLFPKTGYI